MQLKDKNGKRYYILQGFEADNKNLVCGGANLESEMESQAKQLFEFIQGQIPVGVARKLLQKMSGTWWAKM